MTKRRRKLQSRPRREPAVVGVAWYDAVQWALVKAASADPDRLEATFDDWTRMAEEAVRGLVRAGVDPRRVPVRADDLVGWCQARGRPVDGAARAAFALEQLLRGGAAGGSGADTERPPGG